MLLLFINAHDTRGSMVQYTRDTDESTGYGFLWFLLLLLVGAGAGGYWWWWRRSASESAM